MKRQAAPFSRGEPKDAPGRSGRRLGEQYGRKAHRRVPDEVGETLEAPLEERCECGGEIELEDIVCQYQEELEQRAVALATQLNKALGLSPRKTAMVLAQRGIQITPGGVVQAVARQARRLEPIYGALIEGSVIARWFPRTRPGGG